MERIIVISLSIFLSITAVFGQSRKDIKETQKQINTLFMEGKSGEIHARFSKDLKKKLDLKKFEGIQVSLKKQMGEIARINPQEPQFESPYWTLQNTIIYKSDQKLNLQYSLNPQMELEGIFFLPVKADLSTYQDPSWLNAPLKEEEILIGAGTQWPLPGKWVKTANMETVVIFIHGSGPNDMDETSFSNRPFYELAQGFGLNGVASIRYNKRTFEHPEKFRSGAPTLEEEVMEDVGKAVELGRKMGYKKVVLFGHSLGGMVAAEALEKFGCDGLIAFGAPYSNLEDLIVEQMDFLGANTKVEQERLIQQAQRVKQLEKNLEIPARDLPMGIGATYWRSLNQLDHRSDYLAISKPTLLHFGGKDYQVNKKQMKAWKKHLNNQPMVSIRSWPTLNHLMVPNTTEMGPQDYQDLKHIPWETISEWTTWIKTKIQ